MTDGHAGAGVTSGFIRPQKEVTRDSPVDQTD